MPTVDFEIDEQTGEFTVDIHGVVGPACENIERMIAEATGQAATSEKKPSYYQRVVQKIRGRG